MLAPATMRRGHKFWIWSAPVCLSWAECWPLLRWAHSPCTFLSLPGSARQVVTSCCTRGMSPHSLRMFQIGISSCLGSSAAWAREQWTSKPPDIPERKQHEIQSRKAKQSGRTWSTTTGMLALGEWWFRGTIWLFNSSPWKDPPCY